MMDRQRATILPLEAHSPELATMPDVYDLAEPRMPRSIDVGGRDTLRRVKLFLTCAAVAMLTPPPAAAQTGLSRLTIVAPAAPGGGWSEAGWAVEEG